MNLLLAIDQGNIDQIEKLVDRGADLDRGDSFGEASLHHAVRLEDTDLAIEIATLLIDNGVNIDKQNRRKETPLFIAAQLNRPKIIRLLLDAGADKNIKNIEGMLPGHVAKNPKIFGKVPPLITTSSARISAEPENPLLASLHSKNFTLIQNLIRSRLSDFNKESNIQLVNTPDIDGRYPLHIVLDMMPIRVGLLHDILLLGADPNRKDKTQRIPLIMAINQNNTEAVRELLQSGANPRFFDERGNTPLKLAIEQDNPNMVTLIIEALQSREGLDFDDTFDINYIDDQGNTALTAAIRFKNLNMVKHLIRLGLDVDQPDLSEKIPLTVATQNRLTDIIEYLQQFYTREVINRELENGDTRLIHAIHMDSPALRLILKFANPNQKNRFDESPLEIAFEMGNMDTINNLILAGSNLNEPFQSGRYPLEEAITMPNKKELLRLLLNQDIDPEIIEQVRAELYSIGDQGTLDLIDQMMTIGTCQNKEDFITLEPIERENSISILWEEEKRVTPLCYNITELREYLRSTLGVYVYRGDKTQKAYQLPPLYQIDENARTLLLESNIRKYRGFIRDAHAPTGLDQQLVLYTIDPL